MHVALPASQIVSRWPLLMAVIELFNVYDRSFVD
jgi:hypothetical protein